jgi:acetyl-CoA synthetase
VKAFVVLAPGFTPSDKLVEEIQEFVKERTAPYKYPREIEFMDELPKTISGKIKRAVLRTRELERKMERGALGGQDR